jgi:VIT1/CCC1 family predicted Fe2+/Mn2+ transporter
MAILKNWQEEKCSAYLYTNIADREADPVRKKLFLELSEVAEKQARIWENKFKKTGRHDVVLSYKPDVRTKLVVGLIKLFGAESIRFILSAMKVRGMSIYSGAPSHHPSASHLETRHKGLNTAGNLRAAVFGVSDGLVSNASLLLGVVGASADHQFIVLSGVAGLLAGACSMAAGEYISMRSQREFFEYQIDLEREELALYPEEEAAELAFIYRARGIPLPEAKKMANLIISDPDKALDTLAREELGLNPDELGSPLGAAVASFLSFALGAFIPLLPFLFWSRSETIYLSIALTGLSLILIGGMLSLFTNRSAVISGLRMLFIGCLAGGLTFLIGKWVGVAFH